MSPASPEPPSQPAPECTLPPGMNDVEMEIAQELSALQRGVPLHHQAPPVFRQPSAQAARLSGSALMQTSSAIPNPLLEDATVRCYMLKERLSTCYRHSTRTACTLLP